MAFKLADLFVAISAPLGPVTATLGTLKTQLLGLGGIGAVVGQNIAFGIRTRLAGALSGLTGIAGFGSAALSGAFGSTAGIAGIVVGVGAIAAGLGKAGFMAASFAEDVNKAELVFGSMVGRVLAGADDMARRFGVVKSAFVDTSAQIGLMLEAAGMNQKDVTDMSIKLTKLAMDAKSAFNIPMEEAVRKIESGLAGMSRAVRTWGIDLTETNVKQKAFAMGLFSGKGEMDQNTKTLVRAKLLTEGLAIAQDDLEHSQGRLTQAWEGFTGRLTNMAVAIGSVVAPALGFMVGGLNFLLDSLTEFGTALTYPLRVALEYFGLIGGAAEEAATAARQAGIDARIAAQTENEANDAAMAKAMGVKDHTHHGPLGFREFANKISEAAAGGKDALQKKMLAVQQAQLLQLQQMNAKGKPPAFPAAVAVPI